MRSHMILFALAAAIGFSNITGLKLISNGYEDLYVVIGETVPESDELLHRIKEIFTDASELLYTSTHRRAYFKSVNIVIPKTWSNNGSYSTVSALISSTIHIKVGNQKMIMPFTVGNEKCGKEGMYTHLHYQAFVLKQGSTLWGKHDSVLVHEWGHLRWGLKDEYPTIIGPGIGGVNPNEIVVENATIVRKVEDKINFYQDSGMWKPVSCSGDISGYTSTSCRTGQTVGDCNQGDTSKMIGENCKFCPDMTQTTKASIMGFQYIPSVTEFCDKDDPNTPEYMRHNDKAINEQNKFCDGKSAWEIMKEHDDFKNGNNPPSINEVPPTTDFQIVQESSDRVRVLVLDTSGSMAGEKIGNLFDASKYLIETVLPLESWLGIIDFDDDAVVLSYLTQITSNITRQSLVSHLPTVGSGGTCIPCGIDSALELLRTFKELDSIQESEIILISDGLNNDGIMEDATEHCVEAGVVVHCVLITEAADQRLIDIASETGGRIFSNSGSDFRLLAAAFSEIVSSGQTTDSKATSTMKNQQVRSTQNVPANVTFSIDDGLGTDTTVTVVTKEINDIDILLTGPNGYTQRQSASQVRTISLVVPGISEQGQYISTVTCSSSPTFDVIITSKPSSTSAEVIRPIVRLSTNTLDFTDVKTLPIIYVYLRKGEAPVKKATVQAIVEGPQGTETCVLNLLDTGVDPDFKSGDGIYSAVILRECQQGNGRHSSRIVITGTHETVITHYTSSGSAIIDVEANVAEDTATGSFERVAVADAYTVNNYDVKVANTDETPPGRITDVQVIDIQSSIPTTSLTRNYTITWTATGDDFGSGQASVYEMRISNDPSSLRHDFMNAERLNVSGVGMTPNVSGKVERLLMVVSSNDAFTTTTYFAIVAVDEVGNRGEVSNIIPITIGVGSQFEVVEEECTDDCYAVVKDCGRSLTIANGQIDFTNALTTAGNSVPVTCDIGYKLRGGSSINCQEDGTWSQNVTCEIIGCGGIAIANGEIDFSEGTDYNSTAMVRCSDGYHLTGPGTFYCMASGRWKKTSACEINDCGSNITIHHGQLNFTRVLTTYGQYAPITCDIGYRLFGGTHIQCLADGTWSNTVTCIPVDCGFASIANGEISFPAGTEYNAVASIICDDGYWINGSKTLTCLSTGRWTADTKCVIKDCGSNVSIPNGTVNVGNTHTTFGQTLSIMCEVGYELEGGHVIKCQADGIWRTTASCKVKDCRPATIANGAVQHPSGTTYTAVATVSCHAGYEIEGTGHLICLDNGLWSTDTECVIKDCGRNVSLPNGHVDFTNAVTTYGHSLPVICDRGYKRTGGTHIGCLPDGSWSKTTSCQIVDCGPPSISNGEVSLVNGTVFNARASIRCETGFHPSSFEYITCMETGLWSTDSKCALVDCGNNVSIINGQALFPDGNTTYGHSVPVLCDTGFKLRSELFITCQADGTWSAAPDCDIIDCGSTIDVANGDAIYAGKSTTFGQTVSISCHSGFQLNGAANVRCLAEGIWSTLPTCDVIDDTSKSKQETNLRNIVAIVASCIGLIFLVTIALLIRTVIKRKSMRDSRKYQSREIPPDYDMDHTLEDKAIDPAVTSRVWYTHGDRAWRKQHPNWSLQGRPAQANSYELPHRIDPKFI